MGSGLERCNALAPEEKDADLWMIWEEVRKIHQARTLLEVEHVMAHRFKKEKLQMSLFEHFVTEGNLRAGLAKGAMLEARWVRKEPAQSSREDKQCTRHCNTQLAFTDRWRRSGTSVTSLQPKPPEKWVLVKTKMGANRHHTAWCAITRRYRCVRCRRNKRCRRIERARADEAGLQAEKVEDVPCGKT